MGNESRPITFSRALAGVLCGLLVADTVLNAGRCWPLVTGLCVLSAVQVLKEVFELTHQEAKLKASLQKVDMVEKELTDLRGQFKLLKMGYEQGNRK